VNTAYDLLARLVEYPDDDLEALAAAARDALAGTPEAADALARFCAWAGALDPREREEQYIRTFEVQARCCLEAGWHLFGESYKRGALLVKLRVAGRDHRVPASTELPDHLSVLLRLLGRLGPDDDPRGLVEEVILPAVGKMVAALGGEQPSPYHGVLDAIARALREHFHVEVAAPARNGAVHLPMFTAEMEP